MNVGIRREQSLDFTVRYLMKQTYHSVNPANEVLSHLLIPQDLRAQYIKDKIRELNLDEGRFGSERRYVVLEEGLLEIPDLGRFVVALAHNFPLDISLVEIPGHYKGNKAQGDTIPIEMMTTDNARRLVKYCLMWMNTETEFYWIWPDINDLSQIRGHKLPKLETLRLGQNQDALPIYPVLPCK